MSNDDRRAQFIRGLRDFADYLEAHPDVPEPFSTEFLHHVNADTDDAERTEVDRIASLIDRPAEANEDGTHYKATLRFGLAVSYSALAITRAAMDAYHERMRRGREGE